jgi:GDP-D-mannose dehydratase
MLHGRFGKINSSNFWYNKKVFITGHTGFKGTWLTLFLHSLGAEITGYSSHPTVNTSTLWYSLIKTKNPRVLKIDSIMYKLESINHILAFTKNKVLNRTFLSTWWFKI